MAKLGKSKKRKKRKAQKRDLTNLPGLKKNLFSKIKQEYHDMDYIDKLSDKDKAWLSAFMEEDLGANLNHKGKKIYRKKDSKRECFRRNNQRNRDLYSLIRATGRIDYNITGDKIDKMLDDKQDLDTTNPEESMIELLDEGKKLVEDT